MEKRGIPTITLCTEPFVKQAQTIAAMMGMPSLAIISVPHPLARENVGPEQVHHIAQGIQEKISQTLAESPHERRQISEAAPKTEALQAADIFQAVELFYKRGWTDGLPIVPPTMARVQEMLEHVGCDPQEVIGVIPPRQGLATTQKIAVNAVMAGCLPSYLPVIIAAVQAMTEEKFGLRAIQSSTHCIAPLLIINGPAAKELDINCGPNVFGPGWRSNATIGRAVRLILMNIGGNIPGVSDKSTFGHPGKYTYCIAENEAANPWEPLHVERGFPAEASTVTVFGAEAPHNISDHVSATAHGILSTVAGTMSTLGSSKMGETLLVLGPEHAATIVRDGWSKADVRHFLFEKVRVPFGRIRAWGEYLGVSDLWPKWWDATDDPAMVPIIRQPEDIILIVAGGAGTHSMWVPGVYAPLTRSVTRTVTLGNRH